MKATVRMGRVDQVTQRNASAAEELASTAEEMTAQAQALEHLMAFFRSGEEVSAFRRNAAPVPAARPAYVPPAANVRTARTPLRGNGSMAAAADPDFRPF